MKLEQSLHPDLQMTKYRLAERNHLPRVMSESVVCPGLEPWTPSWALSGFWVVSCPSVPRSSPRSSSHGMEYSCACVAIQVSRAHQMANLLRCVRGKHLSALSSPCALSQGTLLHNVCMRSIQTSGCSRRIPAAATANSKKQQVGAGGSARAGQHLWLLKSSEQTVNRESVSSARTH